MRHALAARARAPRDGMRLAREAPLQGYVEGEFVRVGAPFAGTLVKLDVQRGEPRGGRARRSSRSRPRTRPPRAARPRTE